MKSHHPLRRGAEAGHPPTNGWRAVLWHRHLFVRSMLPGITQGVDDFVIPVVQRRTSFLVMLQRLIFPQSPRLPSFRVSVAFQRARSATTHAPASLTWPSQQLESLRKRESALCVRFPTQPASLPLWHTVSCLVPVTRSREGWSRGRELNPLQRSSVANTTPSALPPCITDHAPSSRRAQRSGGSTAIIEATPRYSVPVFPGCQRYVTVCLPSSHSSGTMARDRLRPELSILSPETARLPMAGMGLCIGGNGWI